MAERTCAIDGCDYRPRWRDLCNAHAVRYHRTGERGGPVKRRGPKRARSCQAVECDAPHYCGGYCTRHYQQVRSRGELEPPRIVGVEHHAWRGNDVGYRAAHQRTEKARGSARTHTCVDCGLAAEHWSYNHDDPNENVSDGGQAYSASPDHYSPRCVPCHKRFDLDLGAWRSTE